MTELDSAIVQVYAEFDTPADQVVVNSELIDKFTLEIGRRVGAKQDASVVGQRLLTLRKNGKLPRLRRRV